MSSVAGVAGHSGEPFVFTQWRVVLHSPLSFGLQVASQSLHSLHTHAMGSYEGMGERGR